MPNYLYIEGKVLRFLQSAKQFCLSYSLLLLLLLQYILTYEYIADQEVTFV